VPLAPCPFAPQYAKVIDRRVRELCVECEILPLDVDPSTLTDYAAIIISGGPQSVYDADAPRYDKGLFELGLPIFGICYGMQLMSAVNGGTVARKAKREDGQFPIELADGCAIFAGIASGTQVLLTHGDSLDQLPAGFRIVATSGEITAAIECAEKKMYGVQFHPEVDLSPDGGEMIKNFLMGVCGLSGSFSMLSRQQSAIDYIQSHVADHQKVLNLVSGGVDSAVCAALLNKALGPERIINLHIDHGFMRHEESSTVKTALAAVGVHINESPGAVERFAGATTVIDGRTTAPLCENISPEEKRKIIGDTFMRATQAMVDERGLTADNVVLAQGTLRPDLIESASTAIKASNASVIKTHHNDTALVRQLRDAGRIIEPLKDYHKDEVRVLGMELGLPEPLVWRQPFPGPGLAIRILCADEPYMTASYEAVASQLGDACTAWQGPPLSPALLPVRTVGVQGDGRSYSYLAALSLQGPPDAHWPALLELAKSIPGTVHEVNRVVFVLGEPIATAPRTITPTRLDKPVVDQLRQADAIVTHVLTEHKLLRKLAQVPVVLFPVGFGTDGARSIGIRAFITRDFMTGVPALPGSDALPLEALRELSTRILAEVPGIARVALDISPKPPATTEWE